MRETIRNRRDLLGAVMIWLTGGALALSLLTVVALLGLIGARGLAHFWPADLVRVALADGSVAMGELRGREAVPDGSGGKRSRYKVGNRDLYGIDFRWIDDEAVAEVDRPNAAAVFERAEWGAFFGFAVSLQHDDEILADGPEAFWALLDTILAEKRREAAAIDELMTGEIGEVNRALARLVFELKALAPDDARRIAGVEKKSVLEGRYERLVAELDAANAALLAETLTAESADGRSITMPVARIVRVYRPNDLSLFGKLGVYASRVVEFVSEDPRESNTEGGIFPAIFGTVMMVFLTSLAVTPLGVLAAIHLREYARPGFGVRIVRICVNNLAGVPSIVFGVFGLGFFVYAVGGSLDALFFPDRLPAPTFGTGGIFWASLTLALLTVPVVIVSTEEGLASVPRAMRDGSLALGATKFETLWRVVVPAAMPGILTGVILAMARAAGEVAPLMLVGVVKLAPSLPLDGQFPFVHLERKFMHLGFHIYDVGFQSPNVEAVQPLVYATALLLILVVLATNLAAILLRNHLRRRLATSAV